MPKISELNNGTPTINSKIPVVTNNGTEYVTPQQIQAILTKLGANSVGSETVPIYLDAGLPTAQSGNVGSGIKPIYQSSGALTESSSSVGGKYSPVYLSNGTLTEINSKYEAPNNITSLVGSLSAAIAEQNLEKYGMKLGDYFVGASGYIYYLADMDPYYGGYASYAVLNTHHIGIVVDTQENCRWTEAINTFTGDGTTTVFTLTNSSAGASYTVIKVNGTTVSSSNWTVSGTTLTFNTAPANDAAIVVTYGYNSTAGGYVGSNLHAYLTTTALTKIKADIVALFGGVFTDHMLKHSCLFTTNATTGWAWSSDQYISALTESQVYGGRQMALNGFQTGEAFKKLEMFSRFRPNRIFGNTSVWLRDIYSASNACYLSYTGGASIYNTYNSARAAGLILFY